MSDESDPDLSPAELELAKARLRVEAGQLVRRNGRGGVVTRLPLDDIEQVQYIRRFSPAATATMLTATAGLVAAGRFATTNEYVSLGFYAAAVLCVMLLGVGGIWTDVIEIRTRGETLRIESFDPSDEMAGFAVSLAGMIGGPRGRE